MKPHENKKLHFSKKNLFTEQEFSAESDVEAFYSLVKAEESLLQAIRVFQDSSLFSAKSSETLAFQEELDMQKLEAKNSSPLPKYLQNYIDMSFEKQEEVKESSLRLVFKIAQDGVKLLSHVFEGSALHLKPVFDAPVRSQKDISDVIHLKEQNSQEEIHYELIRENSEEAYLCINFPNKENLPYNQVNLKKNNRFIYSSQIGDSGAVSFSGLKEGLYKIEFIGKKLIKSIDLAILFDHS